MTIEIPTLECKRCGHEWTPRRKDIRMCPKCHTAFWDKPKEKPEKK